MKRNELTELLKNVEPRIRQYFRRNVTNEYDIDDLTQEVLLIVARSIKGFEERSKLSTWVYGICKNVLFRYYSIQRRNRQDQELFDIESNSMDNEIVKIEIQMEIGRMPITWREVYRQFYKNRKSIKEIALMMDKPEGTIKYYLFNIRNWMKKYFM